MSYLQMAKLDVLSAVNDISSESELNEFRDIIARFFADKAQKAIDHMWDEGAINQQTVDDWGSTRMRTPYRHAVHRS